MPKLGNNNVSSSSSSMINFKWLIWGLIAILFRAFPFFLGLDSNLHSRIEFVTPTTSFKRLTEGLYFVKLGLSPYSGFVFLQPPLTLAPFLLPSFFPSSFVLNFELIEKVWSRAVFILADLFIARVLYSIAKLVLKQEEHLEATLGESKKKKKDEDWSNSTLRQNLPHVVAAIYLFNPIMISSCIAMSTVVFNNLALALMLLYSLKKNLLLSTFFLALSTYLTIYPIIYIVPVVFMLNHHQQKNGSILAGFFKATLTFSLFLVGLLALSFYMLDDWRFLQNSYAYPFLIGDLTPNWGIFWYFFTELFDDFRPFFTWMFHIHILAYVIPLSIRFARRDPFFLAFVFTGIISLFKAYPTFGDLFFYLTLLLFFIRETQHTRHGYFVALMLLFSIVLGQVFFHVWIFQGTGNANFFYFVTLIYSFAQLLLLVEMVLAKLKQYYKQKKISTKRD